MKALPPIVYEVIQEQLNEGKGKKICDCSVREEIKKFIRTAHNLDDFDKETFKKQLKSGSKPVCAHDFEDDIKAEKQLAMMNLFEQFYLEFNTDKYKVKVNKSMMFRAFIKKVLSQHEPEVKEL